MRRIKSLGLGALMALALLAVPAGASAAGGIEADIYPAALTGKSVSGSHQLSFATVGASYTCSIPLSAELSGDSDTVAASLSWGGQCTNYKSNGCKFEFHAGTQNSFEIGPPGCGPITGNILSCTISIPSQSGFAQKTTYTNVGEGSKAKVMISTSATPSYKLVGGLPGCGNVGKTYGFSFAGEWEMVGFNANGSPNGIRAVDSFGALFIAGEEPRFEAENYPFEFAARQDPKDMLDFSMPGTTGLHITCSAAKFDDQISSATADLALNPQYSGCKISGSSGTAAVSLNGCDHELGVDNAAPPYSGSLALSCGGGELEILVDPPVVGKCIIKIPSQEFDVTYENLGEGSSRTVAVDVDGKGISYSLTESGFYGCYGFKGAFEDGQLGGRLTLGSH